MWGAHRLSITRVVIIVTGEREGQKRKSSGWTLFCPDASLSEEYAPCNSRGEWGPRLSSPRLITSLFYFLAYGYANRCLEGTNTPYIS